MNGENIHPSLRMICFLPSVERLYSFTLIVEDFHLGDFLTSRNFVNDIWKSRNIFQKCGNLIRNLEINWKFDQKSGEMWNLRTKSSL